MELESTVHTEINKLNIPNSKILIMPYSEVYPRSERFFDSYFIQISVGSKSSEIVHDVSCSYLDFWYDVENKMISNVNMSLKKNIKGRGFGRGLVEAMESIGKIMDCSSSRIIINTNESFWTYMGYEKKQDYWEKML